MGRQRIRVNGADARQVAAIALAGGIGAAVAGARPTGSPVIDVAMVALGGAGAIWAAASAPWWAGVSAAAIATAFAPNLWLLLLGALGATAGMAIGVARRSLPWSRALVAAAALQIVARLGNFEWFGFTSAVAIVTMLALAVLGVRRRPRRDRRVLWLVLASIAGAGVVSAIGLGVAAALAKDDLRAGVDAAEAGIDLLADGDLAEAKTKFEQAAILLSLAEDDVGAPWAQPSRLLPVAAQHRNSAASLVGGARDLSATIAGVLAVVDYDNLRVVNGRFDLAAIEAIEQPLQDLNDALADLDSTLAEARSPWLIDALDSRLDKLAIDIDQQQVTGANALAAIKYAPALLGRDSPRRYFIAFTTPAEARGVGGFMGNWAEITIDGGKLSVSEFGRTKALNDGGNGTTLDGVSNDFVNVYGGFLFSNTDTRTVGEGAWSNLTASPDFPAVAAAMAELYPKSGGRKVDGVFVMDVYALAKLMEVTGDVTIADRGITVGAATAAQFLLTEQYAIEASLERADLLEEISRVTIERLLTTTLPSPPELADLMGPMARQGRFLAWSAVADEQDLFQRINMAGGLPARNGGDGIAVSLNNAAANKIDYYLDGSMTYEVTIDPPTRVVRAVLTLALTNSSPVTGRPDYVIGNTIGLPVGTNRSYVAVHHVLTPVASAIDGQPVPFQVGIEGEYLVSSTLLDIPAGESRTITLTFEGALEPAADYRLAIRSPPFVRPIPIDVTVNGSSATPAGIAQPGVTRLRVTAEQTQSP